MVTIDLSGQSALVTGGSGGIGGQICVRLAEAGAHVDVHYRNGEQHAAGVVDQIRRSGGSARAVAADLSESADIERLFSEDVERCDVLVNNAGIYPIAPIDALDQTKWDAVMAANVTSTVQCTRAAARLMAAGSGGSIINIASLSATRPGFETSHYNASKAAVVSFTQSAACELASLNIRVNAVSPGLIYRPDLESAWPEGVRRYEERSPMERIGTPREVADACLFLASPLSAWITGHNLVIDGGISAVEAY